MSEIPYPDEAKRAASAAIKTSLPAISRRFAAIVPEAGQGAGHEFDTHWRKTRIFLLFLLPL